MRTPPPCARKLPWYCPGLPRFASAVAIAMLVGLAWIPRLGAQTPADGADSVKSAAVPVPTPPAAAAIEVDGQDVSQLSKIEDASLEGLLGLSLEEQLGKTEAASRSNESVLRAPATISTLDAVQIRLSGATTLPDLLRVVPGVSVVHNAAGNDVVSIRGTGGLANNNTILLIDGIPINNPLDGSVSWDLVPLHIEDIERIEVVRGPVSPIYGANAYTGVINVLTRTTAGLPPSYAIRLRGGGGLAGGGAGSVSGRYLHIGPKVRLRWFLNAGRDGTSAAGSARRTAVQDVRPVADHVSTTGALTFPTGAASDLALQMGLVWSRRSSMDHLALDSENLTQRMLFGRAQYEVRGLGGPQGGLKVWAHGLSVDRRSTRTPQTGFSYDGANSLRAVAGADVAIPLYRTLTVLAGGQGSLERIQAPFLHPNASGMSRPAYGFYGGFKANPHPSVDLIVTGRGDLAPISATLDYSYRASAIYHADGWGLRLTGASAFRSPTYVEAAGRFVDPATQLILLEGTDSIRAPRNTAVELGGTFSPNSRLTISPTIYLSRLSNLMVEDFDSVVRRSFRNSPDPRTFIGGELEASWRVNDALTVLPSLGVLQWLQALEDIDTNVGVPAQNSRLTGGLRAQGTFSNDRWGYGLGITAASPRSYRVRGGIPPMILVTQVPTTVRVTAMLERQLFPSSGVWGSLRIGASLPGDRPESPLPAAVPLGQSAMFGLEARHE